MRPPAVVYQDGHALVTASPAATGPTTWWRTHGCRTVTYGGENTQQSHCVVMTAGARCWIVGLRHWPALFKHGLAGTALEFIQRHEPSVERPVFVVDCWTWQLR